MPLEHFSNKLSLDLKPIAFISHNIGEHMRVKLFMGKELSQRISNILISRDFLYAYVMSINYFSNQMVSPEYVFGSLMILWFLCLHNGFIVVTIQRY